MNTKKLLGLITSLSLIGGFAGTGTAFAAKNVQSTKVEIEQGDAELINESLGLITTFCSRNFLYPCLKIDDNGTITVSKSNWRLDGPGENSRKIGENFELDMEALKEWWEKDIAEVLNNFYYQNKDDFLLKRFRKFKIGSGAKTVDIVEKLKDKRLFEESISQYVERNWENQLEKFQKQIAQKNLK